METYHDGDYEISGTIKNITNETITGATITLVFYNSEESVQTIFRTIDSDLEAGQEYSFDEMIGKINNLSKALKNLPDVDVQLAIDENGTSHIVNKTLTYGNGTKEVIK